MVLHLCKLCKSSSQLDIYAEDSGFGKIPSRANRSSGPPLAHAEYIADSRPTTWPPTPWPLCLAPDSVDAIWTYRRRYSRPADAAAGLQRPRLQGSPGGRGSRGLHGIQQARSRFSARVYCLDMVVM